MSEGNELLVINSVISEISDQLDMAAEAAERVALHYATGIDRIARLETFIDRVHAVDSDLFEQIKTEFGWSEV